MTYQDMRERLEILERKIAEQGASEAVLLSIDDGIDTRLLLMKRKTLYRMVHPIIEEGAEYDGARKWPEQSLREEKALMAAVAWAQCRYAMPDSINQIFEQFAEAVPTRYPQVQVQDASPTQPISTVEDANATHYLHRCFEEWYEQLENGEENEWEK